MIKTVLGFLLKIILMALLLTAMPINSSAQPSMSPVFGKDIVIHNMPDRDQRNLAICSAFNGWLYAVYTYQIDLWPYVTILRSIDHGLTWEVLLNDGFGSINDMTTGIDIMACGNSLSTFQIFLAQSFMDPTSYPSHVGGIFVGRYKGEPFTPEQLLLHYAIGWYKDVALLSDQACPADTSDPFNMAVVFSSQGIQDTVVMYSSSDGGLSFNSRRVVGISDHEIEKVTAAYGRSASRPNGEYFVAWEEKDAINDLTGHIYTAHTTGGLNSPFSPKFCIDSLNPAFIHKVRDPVISAQASTFNNDSSDLTTVLLFENYSESSNSWNLRGYYNKRSSVSDCFNAFSIADSNGTKIQPDIGYNSFDSTFMVTYFDSTAGKLPFITNSVNLTDPDSWVILSSGYNDSDSILDPNPRVELDFGEQKGFNCWILEADSGKGVALFDATYSTYTNSEYPDGSSSSLSYGSYPNPCSDQCTIWFEIQDSQKILIRFYDLSGHMLNTIADQFFPAGKHSITFSTSEGSQGSYFYSIRSDESLKIGKICVVK